jgi:hypothetical protein
MVRGATNVPLRYNANGRQREKRGERTRKRKRKGEREDNIVYMCWGVAKSNTAPAMTEVSLSTIAEHIRWDDASVVRLVHMFRHDSACVPHVSGHL